MDKYTFLENYLNSCSPCGYENQSQQIWIDYMKDKVDEFIVDDYGTAVGVINPNSDYKVVIEAHVDEVSFIIHYITDSGMIYLKKNGGADHQIAPSKRVKIHTKNGLVDGVFGWPAVHTREKESSSKETGPTLENIFIDCGINKEELEKLGVHVGCLVTYPDQFMKIGNYWSGKSLDNKIGGYIISQIAKRIKEENIILPYGLYIVNSVQEEVGLKGAKMIANRIKPNIAIVTDVTHDTSTPMISKNKNGDIECGKGPVITYGSTIQQKLRELIEDVAEKKEIKFQRKASSSSTGTDTESFAFSSSGIPSALISTPLRYMHTTVEMVNEKDVDQIIDLIFNILKNIEYNHNFKYINI